MRNIHHTKSLIGHSFSRPSTLIPIETNMREEYYLSIKKIGRKRRYFTHKNWINTSILQVVIKCYTYSIEWGLYGSKKRVSEEQIKYFRDKGAINYLL